MGSDNRRIAIAVGVAFLLMLLWPGSPLMPKPPSPKPAAGATSEASPAASPGAGAEPKPALPGAPAPLAAALPVPAGPEETVVLEDELVRATFSSHGGALKSYVLKSPKFVHEVKGKTEPVDLVRVAPGLPWAFAVAASPELGGTAHPEEDPSARAAMRVASRDGRSVTFEGAAGASRMVKTFALGEKPYQMSLRLRVSGGNGAVTLLASGFVPSDAPRPGFFSGGGFVDYVHPICRAGDKTERFSGDKAEEKPAGAVAWAGLEQFYFLAVAFPEKPAGECSLLRGPVQGSLVSALKLPVVGSLDTTFQLYLGPKQLELLATQGRQLEEAIDYGPVTRYFAFFAKYLMKLMQWFQGFVGNWGIAIVLLTVTVKAALLPLTLKQVQSMQRMKELTPKIEKLREKFKDDKEKFNQAQMELFRSEKVNPLGGCLPLLLQMPIFFALWAALQTSVELYREPFLWIHDLSLHDPIYVLPLVMGASMFIMQKVSPQPGDSTQQKVLLYFMPIFFTFIMFQLPAGLALYSVVNNVLSIVQQQVIMRRAQPPPAAA